ncbi:MAG: GGDEF domain-containing protein [Acidimicrobiia bacterium]|nr:GGDEF domain-containing protein [Acidimicrobiia bacterium]
MVDSNESAARMLRRRPGELATRGWLDLVHADDLRDVEEALEQVRTSMARSGAAFRVGAATGEVADRWVEATFVALPGMSSPGAPHVLVAFDDITDRQRADLELAHRATHDPLTGLPNRVLLEDRLGRACDRLDDEGSSVTVLFCDLDRFKPINDEHGHAVGDDVLRGSPRGCRASPATDTVGRYRG